MTKRGRKSAAEMLTQTAAPLTVMQRPEPPYQLWRDDEQDVWRRIVNDLPGDWFSGRNLDLLVEYCTAVVSGRRLAQMIHHLESEAGGMDLTEWTRLLRAQAQQAGVIRSLATSMRISQQATYSARSGATAQRGVRKGRAPWEIE